METTKKLTSDQQLFVFKKGFNSRNWLFVSEDDKSITVKYKLTGHIKRLKKG